MWIKRSLLISRKVKFFIYFNEFFCQWLSLSVFFNAPDLGWVHFDTTLTWCDSGVAVLTPGWTPRILDYNILLAIFDSVADSSDGVIESGSTTLFNDAALIAIEEIVLSLNGNSYDAIRNHLLELLSANILFPSPALKPTCWFVIFVTSLISSLIWIIFLQSETVILFFHMLPCSNVVTSVTSLAHLVSDAISNILLRE